MRETRTPTPLLLGQTVLVTGATRGIGAAIVRAVARDGGTPIIHFRGDAARAKALRDEVGAGSIAQADLSEADGPEALWTRAVDLAGRIDALVNNAGTRTLVTLDEPLERWREVWRNEMQVNLLAAVDLCRAAILHFKAHGGGRIVNIASRAAQRGYSADAIPYAASKAGLLNVTKSIARSFAADNVIAVAIAPGWVRTDMAQAFVDAHGLQAAVGDIPIGAMAEASEIADLVAFALQPQQRSLNGATLDVNGGSYVR